MRIVRVTDRSYMTTILRMSLVDRVPPFPRSRHDAMHRLRPHVCNRLVSTRKSSASAEYSLVLLDLRAIRPLSAASMFCRIPSLARLITRGCVRCFVKKGLTASRSIILLGRLEHHFISNIEAFFMIGRTKCPFVIEQSVITVEI